MAPVPAPDAAFFDITGSDAIIRPNGVDDWDNIQTVFTALDGLLHATVTLTSGTFYSSYQIDCSNFSGEIRGSGSGSTILVAGTVDAPMRFLDTADRRLFEIHGNPSLLFFRETPTGGTPVNFYIHDLSLIGTDAPGFRGEAFGSTLLNLSNGFMIRISPSHPHMTIYDQAVTMTGVAAQSLGFTNITDVNMNEAADLGGVNYVETVDYTVNLATGTVTRVNGGAITPGQVVFVTYNAGSTLGLTACVFDARIEDIVLRGGVLEQSGLTHFNVDVAIDIVQGRSNHRVNSAGDIENQPLYTGVPELAGLLWDNNIDDAVSQPLNGSCVIRRCHFEDVNMVAKWNGIDGLPTNPGGHTFPATAKPRSYIEVRECSFKRAGWGNFAFLSLASTLCSGTDMVVVDNDVEQTIGFVRMAFALNLARSGTWVPGLNSLSVTGNNIRRQQATPSDFGPFGLPVILCFSFSGAPFDAVGVLIADNVFEIGPEPLTNPVISINEINQSVVVNNKFRTAGRLEALEAIYYNNKNGGQIIDNDFSQYRKLAGRADIRLETTASGVMIQADDATLIEDNGTGSVITGGSISTLVH